VAARLNEAGSQTFSLYLLNNSVVPFISGAKQEFPVSSTFPNVSITQDQPYLYTLSFYDIGITITVRNYNQRLSVNVRASAYTAPGPSIGGLCNGYSLPYSFTQQNILDFAQLCMLILLTLPNSSLTHF
jgi:hypothetical protein